MTKEQTNWDKVYNWIKEYNRENEDGEYDAFTDKPHRAYSDVADYVVGLISQEKEKMIEEIKKLDLYWRDKNTIFPERPTQDGLTEMVEREAVINLLQNK